MGSTRRQVFFNCDERYLLPLKVMTYSLLKSADPSRELTVYVAHSTAFAREGCREELLRLAGRYPFAKVVFVDAEEKLGKFASVISSDLNVWSPVMWSGSLITEVLPGDATGNVVYLDVDMMVRHDLEYLYSLDLESGGYLLAAVSEAPHSFFPALQKIGWGPECGDYFNYGTMVVNTDAWRRENVPAKMLDWYSKHPDTFLLNQDTSNVVCGARTLRIPPKWNYFDAWLQRSIRMNPFAEKWRVYPKRDFLEAMHDPCIVHYVGREKPWNFTRRPERIKYHEAMRELGLYDARLEGATFAERAKLAFFNSYHAMLRRYVEALYKHYCKGI